MLSKGLEPALPCHLREIQVHSVKTVLYLLVLQELKSVENFSLYWPIDQIVIVAKLRSQVLLAKLPRLVVCFPDRPRKCIADQLLNWYPSLRQVLRLKQTEVLVILLLASVDA